MSFSYQPAKTVSNSDLPKFDPKFAFYGGFAASISTLCVQPLEVVKTRLILNSNQTLELSKIRGIAGEIIRNESLASFWRGTGPSLLRVLPGAGLYFCVIETLTRYRKRTLLEDSLPAIELMAIGAFARTLMTTLFLPLTVIKTRFESTSYHYRSTWEAARSIFKTEGMSGFNRGLLPTLLRDAPFSGLYYVFYSKSKAYFESRHKEGLLPVNEFLIPAVAGTVSGLIATAITHPPDVIRTQVQILSQQKRQSPWEATKELVSTRGVSALYKGLSLRLLRRPIMTAITWTCYELFKKIGF